MLDKTSRLRQIIITYLAMHLESDLMNKYFIHSTGKISYMAKKTTTTEKHQSALTVFQIFSKTLTFICFHVDFRFLNFLFDFLQLTKLATSQFLSRC